MAERNAGVVRVGSRTTTVTARPRRRQSAANSMMGFRWLMLWPGNRTKDFFLDGIFFSVVNENNGYREILENSPIYRTRLFK
jgi:hypothetical protein